MTAGESSYVLGTSAAERARLIRQARFLEPYTERLLRDAGIGPGQRVLDVGSGVGDVAMLIARLVGPSGSVVGVDQDSEALREARVRVKAAGFDNVTFVTGDVTNAPQDTPFDAAVGRFILMFVPDPISVLNALRERVRPGGIVAFQEASWESLLVHCRNLPLRFACAVATRDALRDGGARTDMELVLYQSFQAAGLPRPHMRLEIPLGYDDYTAWGLFELFCTVESRIERNSASRTLLGDTATLSQRLQAELDATNSHGAFVGLVGAWSRTASA